MKSLKWFADLVSASLFIVMFLAVFSQVIFRYVFNSPVGWAEELALAAFLVGSWWTICWHVGIREHVAFDVVYRLMPERGQAIARIAGGLFVGACLLAVVPSSLKYLEIMSRIPTGVLKIPLSWIFGVFALFLVAVGGRMLWDAVGGFRSLTGRPGGDT